MQTNRDTHASASRGWASRRLVQGLAMSFVAIALVVAVYPLGGAQAGDPGSMTAMHYDMDPTGNTATSLGAVQTCARINENNTLDADEDNTADTVDFDITAVGIPGGQFAMISFQVSIEYDESELTVVANSVNFLLASLPGSSLFDASHPVPDPDADGYYTISVLDTGKAGPTSESGSGVLARTSISSDPGATAGQYLLDYLDEPVHIDTQAQAHAPQSRTVGAIAIDASCGPPVTPGPTPTPTPTPGPTSPPVTPTPPPGSTTPTATPGTPTATPVVTPTPTTGPPTATPTPSGEFAKGDVQCDNDIDPVDALTLQRHIAALTTSQQPGCPVIGGPAARISGAGSKTFGDMNCNAVVDAVDALFILRHVAELPVSLPDGCSPIGS